MVLVNFQHYAINLLYSHNIQSTERCIGNNVNVKNNCLKKNLIHSLPWWPGKFGSTGMSLFNGASPSITILLQTITNECILWCSAGAKGLEELLAGSLVVG